MNPFETLKQLWHPNSTTIILEAFIMWKCYFQIVEGVYLIFLRFATFIFTECYILSLSM